MNVDRQVSVGGPLSDTLLVTQEGRAFIEDSSCTDMLCVHMPAVSRPGQWIARLPDRVFVQVRERSGQDVDELSY